MKPDTQFDLAAACPGLQLGEDGVFYAAGSEAISYPEEGNEACFQIEDQSFWFRHRNDCIRELVRNFPPRGKGPIFDVGGGNGFVAKGLMDAGWDVVLVEPGPSGVRNAKKRGVEHVVCGTTHSAGFKNGSLPAIGVFDVVEHIEDDLGFLRHVWDLLEPGGILYLTIPAYNFLWSHEDVNAGHFRRYTVGGMNKKLAEVGLACFTLLRFVQADLVRQIVNKRGETHDLALANRLLSRIEALEGLDPSKKYQLVRIGNYPWFRRSLMTAGGRKYDVGGDSHMETGFITAHWVPQEVFNYLGTRVPLVHDDFPGLNRLEFAKRYLLQNRQPYPAESSIFLFGDTIFVYLSKPDAAEKDTLPKPAISATKDFQKISEHTWLLEKQENSVNRACWFAISKKDQVKNKVFNGSLTITSDKNLKIQALLCSDNAPYEGSSATYELTANEPTVINLFHRFKVESPEVKLQVNVAEAPEETVKMKVDNLRVVEYP